MKGLYDLAFFSVQDVQRLTEIDNLLATYYSSLEHDKELLKKVTDLDQRREIQRKYADDEYYFNFQKNLMTKQQEIARTKLSASIEAKLKVVDPNSREYSYLTELQKIVAKSLNSSDLVLYDNLLFIDRSSIEEISKLFMKYQDLNINSKMINMVEDYLRKIERNYNENHSVTSLDGVLASNNSLVLASDVKEYNRLLEILNILKKSSSALVSVYGLAGVDASEVKRFKQLLIESDKLKYLVPNIKENVAKSDQIITRYQQIIDKVGDAPLDQIAANGRCLKIDEEEFIKLNMLYNILDYSKISDDLVPALDGCLVDRVFLEQYNTINEELKNAQALMVKEEQSQALALKTNEDKSLAVGEEIEAETKRHKVLNIRESKDETVQFLKDNKNKLIASGLALATVALGLPALCSSLIYTNCHIAFQNEGFVDFCNQINEILAVFGHCEKINMEYASNFPVMYNSSLKNMFTLDSAYSSTISCLLQNIGALGIVGLGSYASTKLWHKEEVESEITEEEKESLITKLKALGLSIKNIPQKVKENKTKKTKEKQESKIFEEAEWHIPDSEVQDNVADRVDNLSVDTPQVSTDIPPVIVVPPKVEITDTLADNNIIEMVKEYYHLKQSQNFGEAKSLRDKIIAYTGIDVNDYEYEEVMKKVEQINALSEEDLIQYLRGISKELQFVLTSDSFNINEKVQANLDIRAIHEHIDELNTERGVIR